MHWRVVRTRLEAALNRGCWRPRPPWSIGMVAMRVAWCGISAVLRMDWRVAEMRLVKEVVKGLVHSVESPQLDAGVDRMSEANRWVSLWRVLTLIARRAVCLSWRPVEMAVAAVDAEARWSDMKDWQKVELPTGTPRTRMPLTSSHRSVPLTEYLEMARSSEAATAGLRRRRRERIFPLAWLRLASPSR